MSIKDDIEIAQRYLQKVQKGIEDTPNLEALNELMEALIPIEMHYRDFCEGCDQDFGDEPGTTYEDGISLEYYIEASWWHEVSLALRKLGKV